MTPRRFFSLAAAALLLAACDDPTRPLTPPAVRSLSLYMVLDPDEPEQPMVVKPPQAADPVVALRGQVFQGDAALESVLLPGSEDSAHDYGPCVHRYGPIVGTGAPPRCLTFTFRPRYGATYRIAASAEGRPEASATVTVPGAFEIRAASVAGSPPGTEGLSATWTHSEGAYRYVVALRSDSLYTCYYHPGCNEPEWEPQGWWVATTDTTIRTTVPADRVRGGMGGWRVEVYAMDRASFDFLSTGTVAEPFPVAPRQNVRGGYGAIGAWVRRSVPAGP